MEYIHGRMRRPAMTAFEDDTPSDLEYQSIDRCARVPIDSFSSSLLKQ